MRLQEWIHHWEVGAGAKLLRVLAAILGFVAVAGLVGRSRPPVVGPQSVIPRYDAAPGGRWPATAV